MTQDTLKITKSFFLYLHIKFGILCYKSLLEAVAALVALLELG